MLKPDTSPEDAVAKQMRAVLLRLARTRWGGKALGWLMSHTSFMIPTQRLRETTTLVAIYHPRPSYAIHILLIPKRDYADLMAVPLEATDFMQELFEMVQILVQEYALEERGYRLIVNGGSYQEVRHLHYHLVSGERM